MPTAVSEVARTYAATAAPGRRVRLSPKLRWQLTQVVADFVAVLVAAMASYGLYYLSGIGRRHYDPMVYIQLHTAFATITVFALHGYGAYREEHGLLRIEAVRRVLRAVFAGVLLTLGLSFLIRFPNVSRITVALDGPLALVVLLVQRFVLWRLRDRLGDVRPGVKRVLIYGAGETGRLLAQQIMDEHHLDLMPVGFLDDDPELTGDEIR